MSTKRSSTKPTPAKTGKKPKSIKDALLGTNEQVLKSLKMQYVGKRLLIKAAAIYGKNVPKGEELFNFLYIIKDVDIDGVFASIEYESKYIVDDGSNFRAYPITDGSAHEIENYRVALIKEDHALYNHYLGKVNKKANNERDADRKLKANSKRIAAEDFSDLQQKFVDDRADPYDLLVLEFGGVTPPLSTKTVFYCPPVWGLSFKQLPTSVQQLNACNDLSHQKVQKRRHL